MRVFIFVALFFGALTAHAATVTAVSLTATPTALTVGQTATISCTTTYSDGTSGACVSPAYSENQNNTVITLSGATMTGYAFGTTTLTGTASGVSGTLAVKVIPPSQESLGAVTTVQALNGVGFNVNPANDWEFSLAAAAGAKHVRFQCGWSDTEKQSAAPQNVAATPRYTLPSYCVSGLASAQKYGLQPDIIAAYGPPYHAILSVAVPGGASAGAKSLNVQFSSGVGGSTLSEISAFNTNIIGASGSYLSNVNSYAGALITGVNMTSSTTATLTLASALTTALPSNSTTLYTINQDLYATPASFNPSEPSIIAYTSYVAFLAQSIQAAGLTGQVEIWNEPPWAGDPWDNRGDFYDSFPGGFTPGPQAGNIPNWGFVGALQSVPAPAGVTYIWGGTEKSGTNSVLDPGMLANTGVAFTEPGTSVTSESFHPYGNNPEDALWNASCLSSLAGLNNMWSCNMFGLAGGNFNQAVKESEIAQTSNSAWGVSHNITETGFQLTSGDNAHQARFIMRQLLGYLAAGVTPLDFYRLYDTSPSELSFLNPTTEAPLPSYTAVAGLTADLAEIGKAPVAAYSLSSLSSIVSYSGSFPLDSVHIVGSRSGDTVNSELLTVWQRSYAATGANWGTLAQPAAVPATIAIPKGLAVAALVNLDTRATVAYTTSGQNVTFEVSDDPIEVLLEPLASTTAPTTASLTLSSLTHTYSGGPQGAVVTTAPAGLSYSITYGGSTTAPSAVGSYPVVAKITNSSYSAATATGTLAINKAAPTLTWTPSTTQVSSGSALGAGILDATSTTAGSFTYTATLSGKAAVTVNSGTVLAAGTYTLTCAFAPSNSADYSSTSKSTSITVAASKSGGWRRGRR